MAIEMVELSIALFLLWAFVYYCYRDYRLDAFREELFAIRGDLFEFAASGHVPFSSPAYTILRNFTNQLIRYAHTLTMSRFIIVQWLASRDPNCVRNVIQEWKAAVAEMESEETRNNLYAFHTRIVDSIALQLARRSVFLLSLEVFIRLILLLLGSTRRLVEAFFRKEDIERLESCVIETERERSRLDLATA
jgi:hypothetical protein